MIREAGRSLAIASLAALAGSPGAGRSRTVLLIRPDHLGDLLFLTPALRRFRAAMPGWRIVVAAGPWAAPVLDDNPDVDEIIEIPFPGFTRARKPDPLQPYQLARHFAALLRQRDFAAAVVLRDDHWWGALLARLAGIPLRIGADDPAPAPLLTLTVPVSGHSAARNAALLDTAASALGGAPPGQPLSPQGDPLFWTVREEDRVEARRLTGSGAYLAMHPGSGAQVKSWPADRWARLADEMAGEGVDIVLTGGADEWALVESIRGAMRVEAQNLAGKTGLRTLGAIFQGAGAVAGVDSGPLHLAVAVGAPTVQLYGPSDVVKFGPWGAVERHRVLRADWHCHHCGDLSPSRPAGVGCMLAVDVAEVAGAVRAQLRQPSGV